MAPITEDHLQQQCLEWFQELGVTHVFVPQSDSKTSMKNVARRAPR